jgi:hypothetical protein
MMLNIKPFDVFVYDYNGDADQDLGDSDVMVLKILAETPERALEIAQCKSAPDEGVGEGQEFVGYAEMDEVPKDALTIGAPGALHSKRQGS